MDRKVLSDYRVALDTALIVGSIVAFRALLFALGVDGMSLSPLTSSIVAGGVFVMGLVVAGTLSDYKDAERAPSDLATELYAILRECESMSAVWGRPDLPLLRRRLVSVVTALRADIDAGTPASASRRSRSCPSRSSSSRTAACPPTTSSACAGAVRPAQGDPARVPHPTRGVPALGVRHDRQHRGRLLTVVTFTDFDGVPESLVTVGFMSFFFSTSCGCSRSSTSRSRWGMHAPTTT